MVVRKHARREKQLPLVIDALRPQRHLSGLVQGRQEHAGKNPNDRDHDEQFNQRERRIPHKNCRQLSTHGRRSCGHPTSFSSRRR
jgi:hypothetical protein